MSYAASELDDMSPEPTHEERMLRNQVEQLQRALNTTQAEMQMLRNLQQPSTTPVTTIEPVAPHTPATTTANLPLFRVPSTKPPVFTGDLLKKQAHEAQAEIDAYLHSAAAQARLYGFRGDFEPATFHSQPSYVDWVATGLQKLALATWRRLPIDRQRTMSWSEYGEWIRDTFSSPLTLTQAIESLDKLVQKGPATLYSQKFNEIVAAIETFHIVYPVTHLCIKYRQGLKHQLRAEADLFEIDNDLLQLQRAAERLDDFYWRTSTNRNRPRPVFRNENRPTPMQIDNLQRQPQKFVRRNDATTRAQNYPSANFRRLTDEEKQNYRDNGWCTYCRSHEHSYSQCPKKDQRRQVTNVQTSTETGTKDETTVENSRKQ
jgi:hypothetical protein